MPMIAFSSRARLWVALACAWTNFTKCLASCSRTMKPQSLIPASAQAADHASFFFAIVGFTVPVWGEPGAGPSTTGRGAARAAQFLGFVWHCINVWSKANVYDVTNDWVGLVNPRMVPRTLRKSRIAIALLGALVLLAPAAMAKHTVTVTSGTPQAGDYLLAVDVANFNLVPFAGKSAMKGEGHIHYLINGKPCDPATLTGADRDKCGATYATTAKSFQYKGLKAGDKVGAELVLSDHTASGTDANGNLDKSRVLTESSVKAAGAPGPAFLLIAIALAGMAVLRRRAA